MNLVAGRRLKLGALAVACLMMALTACGGGGGGGTVTREDSGSSAGSGTASKGSTQTGAAPASEQLLVQLNPSSGGTVVSSPASISCGTACSTTFVQGTVVSLVVAPAVGSAFTGWTGACTGTLGCNLTMNSNQTVTANFGPTGSPQYSLSTTLSGSGSGTVSSTPSGINCGTTCSALFSAGAVVNLTATAAAGSTFIGWSGAACAGTGTCSVAMNSDASVIAVFAPAVGLSVALAGSGSGTVTSLPAGINCGSACSSSFPAGSMVSLAAIPSSGSAFTGWSGACSGKGACTVAISSSQSVTATFGPAGTAPSFTLAIASTGAPTGTVTSSPSGINCGATCSTTYTPGTSVVLTASPAAGYVFQGWSGASCVGTGACSVLMTSDNDLTASFVPQYTASVSLVGSGTGLVTSFPTGVSCGSTCSAAFPSGTAVSLVATPAPGSVFGGWSGACSGADSCNLTLTSNQSVTALFNPAPAPQSTLTISPAGSGTGSVVSIPSGINCGPTCSAIFDNGTAITLIATPGTGSAFAGWNSAPCSGTDPCSFTISSSQTIQANFVPVEPLFVKVGGLGSVVSDVMGIICPTSCAANYTQGTAVVLTATPSAGYGFGGWSGACSGGGTCTVTMSGAETVSADFEPTKTSAAPFLTVTPSPYSFGSVQVGTTSSQTVSLSNTGGAGAGTLTVTGTSVDNPLFNVPSAQFPISLPDTGASTPITLTFSPTAVGSTTGNISLLSNGTNSPTILPVSGIGSTGPTGSGQLVVTPATLYFGNVNVGTTQTQSVTMSNPGTGNTTVSAGSVSGTGFTINSPTFPVIIPAAGSQVVSISFSPTTTGSVVGVVTFTSDASGSSPVVSMIADGNGTTPTTSATPFPNPLSFGTTVVGTTSYQTINLYNTGNTPVTVSSLSTSGAGFNVIASGLPITIPVNQFQGFVVSFSPGSIAPFTGTISFVTDVPGSAITAALMGSGAVAPTHSAALMWTASPSTVDLYRIYRSGTSGGPYTLIGIVPSSSNAFTDYTIMSGNTYYYVVTAVNSAGAESAYSNEAAAVVP